MIWVIGGTSNATEICTILSKNDKKFIVSVTTEFGLDIAKKLNCEVIKEKLSDEKMRELINTYSIKLIVDASHPFATEVSETAMSVAKNCLVDYIRFERTKAVFENAKYVQSYEEVVHYLTDKLGNILITTGSKFCHYYTKLDVSRLFVRVLGTPESVKQCSDAGYLNSQIITMTGVPTYAENLELMQTKNIKYLVTKDSGMEGGLAEKIEAANHIGAEVLIIARPTINYPELYSDYDQLVNRIINSSL